MSWHLLLLENKSRTQGGGKKRIFSPCRNRNYLQSQQSSYIHTNVTRVVAMVLSGGRRKQTSVCYYDQEQFLWVQHGNIRESFITQLTPLFQVSYYFRGICLWVSMAFTVSPPCNTDDIERYSYIDIDITKFRVLMSLPRDPGSTMKSLSQLLQDPLQGRKYKMHSNISWVDFYFKPF